LVQPATITSTIHERIFKGSRRAETGARQLLERHPAKLGQVGELETIYLVDTNEYMIAALEDALRNAQANL